MIRPASLLWILIALNVFLLMLSVFSSIAILSSSPDGIDLLPIAAKTVTAVTSLMLIIQGFTLLGALQATRSSNDLEAMEKLLERVETASTQIPLLCSILMWSVVADDLLQMIVHLHDGKITNALIDLLMAGFLAWLNLRGGGRGDRKKSLGALIGEKSRSVRDALVQTQKGMRPAPGLG